MALYWQGKANDFRARQWGGMNFDSGKTGAWLYRRAENLIAILLGIMFFAFLAQIIFRYLLNFPVGWTSEVTIVTWLWLVLFGAAFVVTEREEIRFDLIYSGVGQRFRRLMAIVSGVALIALYLASLPATYDYVAFMKVQRTSYLHIRFDHLFSIYVIFVLAIVARYGWIVWNGLRGKAPAAYDATKAGSGL